MDSRSRSKKMKWRNSIMCCLGRRQDKQQDLDSEPHISSRSKVEGDGYRKQSFCHPDQYHDQYNHGHSGQWKAPKGNARIVARPTSTKRTSSCSATGNSAETKTTQADSAEAHSSPKIGIARQPSCLNQATDSPLKRRPSRGPVVPRQTIGPGSLPVPKSNIYVDINRDNETITALSMSDMGLLGFEDESRLSTETPPRSVDSSRFGSRYGRSSERGGFASFQPDGFLEATILRSDSDSTRDMSVMGAEFHVGVYNLSERMSYDIREAGRNLSTIATQVAHACSMQHKFIKNKP
mmetsp:Transcript_25831/g.48907  ORF Transcript_25831/g.48907 Transcript_25831/m.48907 type:complete len:294 (-) Transcript_25831:109-990(-)|eukprot:scaffold8728_cov164-Amphora_coffeaeformis.AAC.9